MIISDAFENPTEKGTFRYQRSCEHIAFDIRVGEVVLRIPNSEGHSIVPIPNKYFKYCPACGVPAKIEATERTGIYS